MALATALAQVTTRQPRRDPLVRGDTDTQGAYQSLLAWGVVPHAVARRCQNCGKRLGRHMPAPQNFQASLCSTDCLWTLFFARHDEQRVQAILGAFWHEIDCSEQHRVTDTDTTTPCGAARHTLRNRLSSYASSSSPTFRA